MHFFVKFLKILRFSLQLLLIWSKKLNIWKIVFTQLKYSFTKICKMLIVTVHLFESLHIAEQIFIHIYSDLRPDRPHWTASGHRRGVFLFRHIFPVELWVAHPPVHSIAAGMLIKSHIRITFTFSSAKFIRL